MSLALAAGASVASDIASQLIGNSMSSSHDYEMFKRQKDFAREMFDKTNAYNSPANQLALLQAAGLSPSMMMSSGTDATASMPNTPSASTTPLGLNSNFAQSLIAARNAETLRREQQTKQRITDKQIEQITHEIDKIDNESFAAEMLGKKYASDEKVNMANVSLLKERVKETAANILNLEKTRELFDGQIANMQAQAELAKEQKNWVKYEQITKRISANSQSVTASATAALYKKYGEKTDSEIKLNEKTCEKIESEIVLNGKDARMKDVKLEYYGEECRANVQLLNGRVKKVEIENEIADAAKYAQIVDAYVQVVDDAAQAVSHSMEATLDVMTGGASTKLNINETRSKSDVNVNSHSESHNINDVYPHKIE